MKQNSHLFASLMAVVLFIFSNHVFAESPWGSSKFDAVKYAPQKVVYDVAVESLGELEHVIDRVSYLNKLTNADPFDSSTVVVLHGPEIKYFAHKNYPKFKTIMDRAQSLTVGGIIKFRMCKLAAEGQGFKPADIHGFVEMVPMGDAEIIRLQEQEKHAYMR